MTILSTDELSRFPREALREMREHATAMRELTAQYVNAGPGGLWGRLDRLIYDIDSRESELDDITRQRRAAFGEIKDALAGKPLTGDEHLSG
jgi:sugar phosphate isomerase/epimerase